MMRAILTLLLLSIAAVLTGANPEDGKKPEPAAGSHCSPPVAGAPALPAKLMDGMGVVDFPITTVNPEAQKFFNQGIAQMHSFWSREAERSFRQAAALDPEAPMPWWGVAMVSVGDFRPQFQIDAGNEVMGKQPITNPRAADAVARALRLAEKPGAASPKEKLYIAAIAARRDLKSDDPWRGYTEGLRAIIRKYPDEVEAKLYLTLQIMRGFTLPEKLPRPGSMEAVAILKDLLKTHPKHPGLHHYVIHGFEGSTFAEQAEYSSHYYATLASEIPHALHMPGHIFSQTGKWSEAAKYFELAKAKEIEYMNADPTYGTGHHGHNTNYLSTAYSFGGDYEKAVHTAKGLLEYKESKQDSATLDTFYSAYRQAQFALIRALVQHEKWDEILEGKTIPEIAKPRPQAWLAWARGIAYAAKGKPAEARAELEKMDRNVEDVMKMSWDREARELNAGRIELRGHIEIAEGQADRGFATLRLASEREQRLRYSEPPWYPRPVAEALGWQALRHGRPALAREAFHTALKQYQNDARALEGLKALEQAR